MSNWSAKNPYNSKITESYVLNGEGSRKETRHIVFALGDSGLDYKVGDALGVLPENPPHILKNFLKFKDGIENKLLNHTRVKRTFILL